MYSLASTNDYILSELVLWILLTLVTCLIHNIRNKLFHSGLKRFYILPVDKYELLYFTKANVCLRIWENVINIWIVQRKIICMYFNYRVCIITKIGKNLNWKLYLHKTINVLCMLLFNVFMHVTIVINTIYHV